MTTDDLAIAQWEAGRDRLADLVASLTSTELGRRVPACPDWTVHDLLSHVVGLAADVVAGDEPDDHDATWTQGHVDARRDTPTTAVLAEWDDVAPRLVTWMREHGTRPLNDLMIHEQDVRGAVGRPGARDTDGLAIVRETMLGRLADAVAGLPPLALVPTDASWSWCSAGEVADAVVVVEAPAFDLTRALTSRRTAEQLRGWTVRGDLARHLDAFALLGPLPAEALTE